MTQRERMEKLSMLRDARSTAHVRGSRLLRPRKRLLRMLQPDMIRLEYAKALRAYLRKARAIVQLSLVPHLPALVVEAERERRSDSASKDADGLIDRLAREFISASPTGSLERLAASMALRTSKFQRQELRKILAHVVAVEPENLFLREPNIAARVEQFTTENVSLIKSIPEKYFGDVKKVVLAGLADGDRADQLSDEIEARYSVAESSADLVARDQIGKFFGDLNEARQTELGIERFTWRTMADERVRDSHVDLEGEEFEWDDPPVVDGEEITPGQAVNCRCYAEPVLDDILGDL